MTYKVIGLDGIFYHGRKGLGGILFARHTAKARDFCGMPYGYNGKREVRSVHSSLLMAEKRRDSLYRVYSDGWIFEAYALIDANADRTSAATNTAVMRLNNAMTTDDPAMRDREFGQILDLYWNERREG